MSRRLLVVAIALVVVLTATYVVLVRRPSFEPVAADAETLAVGAARVDGSAILPFRAEYRRWNRIMGVRMDDGVATLSVTPTWRASSPAATQEAPEAPPERPGADRGEPALLVASEAQLTAQLEVVITLGDAAIADRMILDAATLAPRERRFDFATGGGQSFVFHGERIDATIHGADGSQSTLPFEYPLPVFEVSVLELTLAASMLSDGAAGRIAWDNMADPTAYLADFRVVGAERLETPVGSFDTTIVRVRFGDGRMRDFWLSEAPPYKVRMHSYSRGQAVYSGWELERLDLQ